MGDGPKAPFPILPFFHFSSSADYTRIAKLEHCIRWMTLQEIIRRRMSVRRANRKSGPLSPALWLGVASSVVGYRFGSPPTGNAVLVGSASPSETALVSNWEPLARHRGT